MWSDIELKLINSVSILMFICELDEWNTLDFTDPTFGLCLGPLDYQHLLFLLLRNSKWAAFLLMLIDFIYFQVSYWKVWSTRLVNQTYSNIEFETTSLDRTHDSTLRTWISRSIPVQNTNETNRCNKYDIMHSQHFRRIKCVVIEKKLAP